MGRSLWNESPPPPPRRGGKGVELLVVCSRVVLLYALHTLRRERADAR